MQTPTTPKPALWPTGHRASNRDKMPMPREGGTAELRRDLWERIRHRLFRRARFREDSR